MPLEFSSSNPCELDTDLVGAIRPVLKPSPRRKKKALHNKQEGRPSRWKDGLARSFAHGSTHHFRKERGSKHLAWWHLGPLSPGVQLMKLRGT